jgi:hypothetical protein
MAKGFSSRLLATVFLTGLAMLSTISEAAVQNDASTQPAPATGLSARPQREERLSFQAKDPYRPRVHLNADVAMVYGIDQTLPQRIKSWRDQGYIIHVMTGCSWGEYQDYYFGRWDGKHREDEAQTMKNGEIIGHGGDVYYISPGEDYGRYLCEGVKRALDAGAEAIHLEEPEYWVRAGWSGSFKRQWQKFYNEPWIEPDSSPDAQYRASKLKYYLYRKTLAEVFEFVKAYGKQHGREIKCYVPTHSMINYASWGIVSPESSLLEVGADGFIAQVWTGTARTPNFYNGIKRQRTFETAFLEYGAMQTIVRASGKRVWYLNDPIEDNARHSWWDYRTNWESTLVASLLQPEVWHFEIMPWPHRIFEKKYPSTQRGTSGNAEHDVPHIPIPDDYASELQAVISAMGDMKQPADRVGWDHVGTLQTGVLVSDTLMFQRFGPDHSDEDLGHFYGLALPLLMRGLPVEPVQVETAELNRYKTLLLTYEGQKPPKKEFHDTLAAWVKAGGALVVIDDDRDPFNGVREWWNTGQLHYKTPRHHLFDCLDLAHNVTGEQRVGRGTVIFENDSPSRLSHDREGSERVRALVQQAMSTTGQAWKESAALVLRRGPYIVVAGLGDRHSPAPAPPTPLTLTGRFIPLFDATQPIVHDYPVSLGARGLLVDLDRYPKDHIGVIAAACRITNEKVTSGSVTFDAIGQDQTTAVVSLLLPQAPARVTINGETVPTGAFDHHEGVLRIRFANTSETLHVAVTR